ncbi:DUF6173 family protein [Actibacterium sp.]|uniref:DUF6173 family protein n=1 Tax=Actibacterium sp. TaxID=1872125 RepID=UPI0035673F71
MAKPSRTNFGDCHEPPRAKIAHADPGPPLTETLPLPEAVTRRPVDEKSAAEWAYERLILYIRNFEELLDSEHEVAMGFAGGDVGILRIEGVGYFDPDIITFYGSDDDGARTQLIQHVSQLNVLLQAMPKAQDAPEARRIGFRLFEDLEQEE